MVLDYGFYGMGVQPAGLLMQANPQKVPKKDGWLCIPYS